MSDDNTPGDAVRRLSLSQQFREIAAAMMPTLQAMLTPAWLRDDAEEVQKTKDHGYMVGLSPEQTDEVIRRLQGEKDTLPRKHEWSWVRMVLTEVALGLIPFAEGKERSDP